MLKALTRIFQVFTTPPDAGSGGGASGASGASGAGSGGGLGPAGSGDAQAYKLTDDALVDLGDGKPVKWSEARSSRYMDRTQYDQGVKLLDTIASQLDQREQVLLQRMMAAAKGEKPNGQALPPSDPFADLENVAVVDGRMLANLARKMAREGFGQMATALTSLAQKVTALEKSHGTTSQQAAQLTEREYQQQFDHGITNVLSSLADVKGLPEGVTLDPQSPFLRELAADTWLSHEADSWKPGEFEKMLGDRISKAVAFVRSLDKSAIGAAEKKRKEFFANPGKGNARPNGEPKRGFENGTSLARMLFSGTSNPT